MIYPLLLLSLFLFGCSHSYESGIVKSIHARKQKQKIAVLQKKLKNAQAEEERVKQNVEKLIYEIAEAKLMLIRKQLDDYERKVEPQSTLFMEEREALYEMIQTGQGSSAVDAQVELDRILRLITESSDEEKYAY